MRIACAGSSAAARRAGATAASTPHTVAIAATRSASTGAQRDVEQRQAVGAAHEAW